MPGPEQHAKLSPSSAHRWLVCPFSKDAPDLPAGPAAKEGTIAHSFAANVLLGDVSIEAVPKKFRAGIEMYVGHVRANNYESIFIEQYWPSIDIPDHGGTLDTLLVNGNLAVVYDYKSGRWPKKAENNPQLLSYAGLVSEHFDLERVFGVIIQPKSSDKEQITTAEYSKLAIIEHRAKVAEAGRSDHKQAGEHCRFCPFRTLHMCEEGRVYGLGKRGW